MPRETRSIFPFLSLPAELRVQIYEECFALPCEIDATLRIPPPQPFLVPGALLRTCRQVHYEANGILYSRNTFRVGDDVDDANFGLAWLHRIGAKNAKLIQRVVVEIRKWKSSSWLLPFVVFLFELRVLAPDLQELSVFLGEEQSWRCQTQQEMLGTELSRYTKLKKLVLGGNQMSALHMFSTVAYGNLERVVELAPTGSEAFEERKKLKACWAVKIEADAKRIYEERAIRQWQLEQAITDSLLVGERIQSWRRCPCYECEVARRLGILIADGYCMGVRSKQVQSSNWPNDSYLDCWTPMPEQRVLPNTRLRRESRQWYGKSSLKERFLEGKLPG